MNAEKVAVSGKKRTQKLYRRHSGRPGGMKEETFDQLQQRIPERIIEHAVRGMLPKGRVSSLVLTQIVGMCMSLTFMSSSFFIIYLLTNRGSQPENIFAQNFPTGYFLTIKTFTWNLYG